MRLTSGEGRVGLTGRMRGLARPASALILGSALVVSGCGVFDDPPEPIRMTAPPEDFQPEGSASADPTPQFTIVDSMFSLMMIPHHEQALDMAALVPERSSSPEVQALAEEIEAAQAPEIEQMQGWLDEWGIESEIDLADHADHAGMEGMLTDEQMERLAAAEGAEFDRLWLEGMIAHHEGAVVMAETVLRSGTHRPSQDLAEEIIATQQAEITRMQAMLGDTE